MTVEEFFNRTNIIDLSFFNFRNAISACYFADPDLRIHRVNENFRRFFPILGDVANLYFPDVLKQIGVDDIACLVDFGVPTQVVLDHLPFLDQVRAREQSAAAAGTQDAQRPSFEEHPLLTDVRTHAVTHLQCTPSMARMFLGNEETRSALAQIQHLFLGGEADAFVDILPQVGDVASVAPVVLQELHQRRLQRQDLADKPGFQFGRVHGRARTDVPGVFPRGVGRLSHSPARVPPVAPACGSRLG